MKIAISAGHGSKIAGASDIIDEADEAWRVVQTVANDLLDGEVDCEYYRDTVSTTQDENLQRLVDWHNNSAFGGEAHDLDVSVHFNCSNGTTSKAIGTECWYYTTNKSMKVLADDVATAIARASGLIDRGPKPSDGLYFLRNTQAPAILIEVCFVNSKPDCAIYRDQFQAICAAIAQTVAADEAGGGDQPDPTPELPVSFKGTCSWFGGPDDDGVSPSEGLAFLYEVSDAPDLFLPTQPPGTTGLARRLDPETFYVATRWDYSVTPKEMLRDQSLKALVRTNGKEYLARPADWGPNEATGRVADLSPGLLAALGLETDDQVEVIYPANAEPQPAQATVHLEIAASGPVQVFINGKPFDHAA